MAFKILDNGDLLITADNEARAEMTDLHNRGYSDDAIMMDMTEFERCNGGFTPFNAGDGNPFVGLTSAPCIAESMDCLDDGTMEIVGRFWYFGDYMIRSEVEELRTKGRVVYTLGSD